MRAKFATTHTKSRWTTGDGRVLDATQFLVRRELLCVKSDGVGIDIGDRPGMARSRRGNWAEARLALPII